MKHLIRVLVLIAFAAVARADYTIEAYLTITTNPAVANTLSVTGVGITWTNNTGASSYWVQTTNSTANATTNLYLKLSTLGLTNVNGVNYTNSTNLVLYGKLNNPLTVTIGGTNWASVGYKTNLSSASFLLALPLNTANKTNQHTNIVNEVRNLLSYDYATNPVSASAPLFNKYLGQNATNQSFTNKTFFGGTNAPSRLEASSGWLAGMSVSNAPFLGATNARITSARLDAATIDSLTATNPVAWNNLYIGDSVSGIYNSWALQTGTNNAGKGLFQLYNDDLLGSTMAILQSGGVVEIFLGSGSSDVTTNSGLFYSTRIITPSLAATNVSLGNAAGTFSSLTATTAVLVAGSATNLVTDKATAVRASLNWVNTNNGALLMKSAAVTSLAGGNNILTRSTNNLVRFTSAGSAPNLNAITNGLGDGDWFWAVNQTAETITIVNESGFTSIPENRIHLANGASNVTVGPYGMALFLHEPTTLNRWLCLYPDNDLPTTTSNALVTLAYTLAAANTNYSVSLNNSLSNRLDSLLAANTNWFSITTNDFALNTYYTNANQRAWVAAELDVPGVASASLFLDQNADGTWERTGLTRTNSGPLSAFIQPGARFLFTNQSGSPVIRANSSQWVKQ